MKHTIQILPILSGTKFMVRHPKPVFSGRMVLVVDTIEHALSIRRDFS